MKELIAFIFRLVNFGLLIGVFYYVFKKYLFNSIQDKITEKKQVIEGLLDERQGLEYTQQEMDRVLVQQAQLCTSLKEQISQWRARVELELAHRLQEKKTRREKLTYRMQQKSDWLKEERIKKMVLPVAIEEARKDLREKFATESAGRAYISSIITHIEKNRS